MQNSIITVAQETHDWLVRIGLGRSAHAALLIEISLNTMTPEQALTAAEDVYEWLIRAGYEDSACVTHLGTIIKASKSLHLVA